MEVAAAVGAMIRVVPVSIAAWPSVVGREGLEPTFCYGCQYSLSSASVVYEVTYSSVQGDLPVGLRGDGDGSERARVSALVTTAEGELALLCCAGLLASEVKAEFLRVDFTFIDESEKEGELSRSNVSIAQMISEVLLTSLLLAIAGKAMPTNPSEAELAKP